MADPWRRLRADPRLRDPRYLVLGIVVLGVGIWLIASNRITSLEVIYLCVLIPSIILHEISHGVVALACGDDTAQRAGRLTLNPIRHVDPVGTIVVPIIMALSSFGAFGWAKPVPVNPRRLRSPRNQMVLVSLAGPTTNFVLAGVFGLLVHVFVTPAALVGVAPLTLFDQILVVGGFANLLLGLFNLLPIPPLDGASLLERALPAHMLEGYYRLQPALMFLPVILVLWFHNLWVPAVNHVFTWWLNLFV